MEENTKHPIVRALNELEPVHTFALGIVSGLLVLCTVGFFILLGNVLKSDETLAGNNDVQKQDPADQVVDTGKEYTLTAVDTKVDHIRGNQNAKITIIEYSDTECPYCNRFHATMKQIMDTYGDQVRWVLRHNPLDGLHANARKAAVAEECAGEQGKFWELADYLYNTVATNGKLDGTQFKTYASAVGLNTTKFETCLNSTKYNSKITRDQADVSQQGTPFSVIVGPNGEETPINGAQPYEAVEQAIKALL